MNRLSMTRQQRIGRDLLLASFAFVALLEIVLLVAYIQAGRLNGGQVSRSIFTIALLWLVWVGVGWARWLMVVLWFIAGSIGVFLGVFDETLVGRTAIQALVIGLGFAFITWALVSASPPVGAFLEYQRDRR